MSDIICGGLSALGIIVACWTNSKGAGGSDAWVFKLDKDGNLECE